MRDANVNNYSFKQNTFLRLKIDFQPLGLAKIGADLKLKSHILTPYLLIFAVSCNGPKMSHEFSNNLKSESSLYLQQHSGNPVQWYPWTDEAWAKAKKENKLVLVSIGYSSCHWCHVMERETFEDTAAARIMNENFVCIKVDREERPDIDQVYMNAVQLMTGSGGWPLNCFTLPDGRPIYGGTYFPNAAWKELLMKLNEFYKENPQKAEEYASELTHGLQMKEFSRTEKSEQIFSSSVIQQAISNWKKNLDTINGGPNRAPKFPLPVNYRFLLRYAVSSNDKELMQHINLTLTKMAYGGIYDHIAGGFARYSTDTEWKVPHFEKMLYDNAQLISLYSLAFKATGNALYKQVAAETIHFVETEMSDGNGAYYSSIDADSEGEEGKFYIWTIDEIRNINFPACGKADPFAVFSDYFNLNAFGHWEDDKYILNRKSTDEAIAAKHRVSISELSLFIAGTKKILMKKREERERPVTDRKVVTSWNALMISGLCHAYEAFGEDAYRTSALTAGKYLLNNLVRDENKIVHIANPDSKNEKGFLEDYAFTIRALIDLYQITFDEHFLLRAKEFADDAVKYFHDTTDGFFYYTSNQDSALVARTTETMDNVIPSSNSEMGNALFLLGEFFDATNFKNLASFMLASLENNMKQYPSSYSNWMNLFLNFSNPFSEVVITGENAEPERKKLACAYLPSIIIAGSNKENSELPLLEGRFVAGKTLFYVCKNKTCRLPATEAADAISMLQKDLLFREVLK